MGVQFEILKKSRYRLSSASSGFRENAQMAGGGGAIGNPPKK